MNELTTLEKALQMWRDDAQLKTIKEIYAPKLTAGEFQTFVQLGIATELNPFLREIWAVKYGDNAAQIFIGRDGYRKVISRNANYKGHHVDAVYSNDDFCFDLSKGEVRHTYKLGDRGKLIGAYCVVHMNNIARPYYVFVELSEYNTGQSVWKTKPATMIKKVAECQGIRMADCAVLGGTYDQDEIADFKTFNNNSVDISEDINELIAEKKTNSDAIDVIADEAGAIDVVNTDTGEVLPAQQTKPAHQIRPNILANQISNAKSLDTLNLAAELIQHVDHDKQDELKAIYHERLKEFQQ